MSIKVINLRENFPKNIGVRESAKRIFKELEGEDEAILNFQGIEFISRTFAQEYAAQRYYSKTKVKEENMEDFVSGLIDFADKEFRENCL